MTSYKKKPIIIEAVQWICTNPFEILDFIDEKTIVTEMTEGCKSFKIATLEGDMTVSENDYIIRGIKGELYPCKPDIFEATYEEVDIFDDEQERVC